MGEPTEGTAQRRVHRNRDGVAVLTYLPHTEGDQLVARDVEVIAPGAPDSVMADMSGFIVSGPVELGEDLAARGATVRRRFRKMTRALAADPPPASWAAADLGEGRREVPVDRDPQRMFPAWRAAYANPANPDRVDVSDQEFLTQRLTPILTGAHGPVLPWSRLVVEPEPSGGERVVAGVVMIEFDATALIADVFRDPDPAYAGLGSALLQRVLAAGARAGTVEVRLSVTEANPALRVYERLGFVTDARRITLVIP